MPATVAHLRAAAVALWPQPALTAAAASAQVAPPGPTRWLPKPRSPMRRARSRSARPWHGRLEHGVQLPQAGTDFVTWDPCCRVSPNRPQRRWGTDALVVLLDTVTREFREAHPDAPPLLIADLSRPHGGPFGRGSADSATTRHQNGLDADVMYPRRPRAAARPCARRRSIARWPRTSSTASARPVPSSSSSGRTCACAGPAGSSCRSCITTTTCTCGSPTRARRAQRALSACRRGPSVK